MLIIWLQYGYNLVIQPFDMNILDSICSGNDMDMETICIPSGKHTKIYGKSQFLMGTSTISMVIFNSYMLNYQRISFVVVFPTWNGVHPPVNEHDEPGR